MEFQFSSWNQKNLDYEIETILIAWCPSTNWNSLKSKEPRLRDWNIIGRIQTSGIKRTLKSKEPRLRDWNMDRCGTPWGRSPILKSKEPRLRDWNVTGCAALFVPNEPLEIKRTSITRLKHIIIGIPIFWIKAWNQKNLDYEIETGLDSLVAFITPRDLLKSKEPRLRDWNHNLLQLPPPNITSWNQKNLDYEIETIRGGDCAESTLPWNQKNLDYEIETRNAEKLHARNTRPDDAWNQKNLDYEIETWRLLPVMWRRWHLKSKEPRLRDWNIEGVTDGGDDFNSLEIKRTSITRLKHVKVYIFI